MPSPLGHVLGAFAAGWLIAGPAPVRPLAGVGAASSAGRGAVPQGDWRGWRRMAAQHANLSRAMAFGLIGVVADVDLLLGMHSAYTHSIGAALVVFLLVLVVPGGSGEHRVSRRRLLFASAAAAAYLTHPIFDWLGQDDNPPIGVMFFWPVSGAYFHSGLDWFHAISRRYWLPGFWAFNLRSIARELLLLGPVAALAVALRRPGRATR